MNPFKNIIKAKTPNPKNWAYIKIALNSVSVFTLQKTNKIQYLIKKIL